MSGAEGQGPRQGQNPAMCSSRWHTAYPIQNTRVGETQGQWVGITRYNGR